METGSVLISPMGVPLCMEKEGRGLQSFILSQIKERGPIPFSQFMEWCLYHSEYGYYRSVGAKIGRNGDYYTSPCVHPVFGYLVGRQLHQMAEILGGKTFDIVEMGGGRGWLCRDILHWAKKDASDFYLRLRYHLVETSPYFLKEQKEILSEYERDGKISWMHSEVFNNGKVQIEGCFLSNELIDSFPVHQVMFRHGKLKELYIAQQSGRLEEYWGEPSDSRIFSYFQFMGIPLQEGQRAEVNLNALDWMEKVARCLQKGFVLTIDYGYLAEELYAPHRRDGTVLCYSHHRASENPYDRLGEQDITSHVNFTSLIKKGEEAGLQFTGLVPQYQFLIALGFLQEMESLGKEMSDMDALQLRLSLKHLIEPEVGMGEVFKILIQHKGINQPQLDGLRKFSSIPWTKNPHSPTFH